MGATSSIFDAVKAGYARREAQLLKSGEDPNATNEASLITIVHSGTVTSASLHRDSHDAMIADWNQCPLAVHTNTLCRRAVHCWLHLYIMASCSTLLVTWIHWLYIMASYSTLLVTWIHWLYIKASYSATLQTMRWQGSPSPVAHFHAEEFISLLLTCQTHNLSELDVVQYMAVNMDPLLSTHQQLVLTQSPVHALGVST
jgi:hypothetical protein